MAINIPEGIPNDTGWCQICGKEAASPCDVVILHQMLEVKGVPDADTRTDQAHAGCFSALRQELDL
jgi:hypothetical protein